MDLKKSFPTRWLFVLTPFFFAAYSILNVAAINVGKINPSSLFSSLVISFLVSIVPLAVIYLLFRQFDIAVIFASLGSFAFFTYGYFYDFAAGRQWIGDADHPGLVTAWLAAFIAVGIGIYFLKRIWKPLREFLFFVGLVLCLWAVVSISGKGPLFTGVLETGDAQVHSPQPGEPISAQAERQSKPDVYYIILDAYGRADILNEYYGFDNTEFLSFLIEKGFYIAEDSQSNYAQTRLSLPSSLNMDYLDNMLSPGIDDSQKYSELRRQWESNAVFSQAEDLGYTTIFFDNGMNFSKNTRADRVYRYSWMDDYYAVLIDKTLLRPYRIDFEIREDQQIFKNSVRDVQEVPEIEEPTFTFLHILYPHLPYIFDRNGDFPTFENARTNFKNLSWYPISAYIDQLWYVNVQTEKIISAILEKSEAPPIIVVQADHGPGRQDPMARQPILNAYYLPGSGSDLLYSSISPVNTFRLIFDFYFGTHYGLLEDHSWFSLYSAVADDLHINFEFCQADDFVNLENSNDAYWLEMTTGILQDNGGRIGMDLNDCDLGLFLAPNDNLRGYEVEEFHGEAGFRWGSENVEFRLPVLESGVDYQISALIRNTLPSAEVGSVSLVLGGKVIDQIPLVDSTDLQAIEFTISTAVIGDNSVIYPTISYPFSTHDRAHGNISLRYYGLEWKPISGGSP